MKKKFLSLLLFFSLAYATDPCPLDHALVGIFVVECTTGKEVLSKNAQLSLTPASCMKLVTTAAALHILGPETRFETVLEYDGKIDKKKTLHGNLYIRGGGDPCLGSGRTSSSLGWKEQVAIWADAVEKAGIQRLSGTVIADATAWEEMHAVPSWEWEDLGNYYGAGACALSFHENAYSLFFAPGVENKAPIIRFDPPMNPLFLRNEVTRGPADSGDNTCIFGSEISSLQIIRGTIPLSKKEFVVQGAIADPPALAAELLRAELEKRGIRSQGKKISSHDKRHPLHTTLSPSIKEIVYWTNQKSINLYAEHLLKKMGKVKYASGSTEAGIRAVRDFLSEKQIDLQGFNMVDGSGLSRQNFLTSEQLVSLLLKMKTSPHFASFFDSLPQLEANLKAKSGSMSSMKGYAGYAGDRVFALLVNHYSDKEEMKTRVQHFLSNLNTLTSKDL